MSEDLISIGKWAAPHGTSGELILQHVLADKKPLQPGQPLLVEMQKGSRLPYFVQQAKARTDAEQTVLLEEVDSREKAARLTGKTVWIPAADLSKYAPKQAPLTLVGYELFDGKEKVGPVISVIEQPHQLLLEVDFGGKEALIPLHEETLKQVDHKTKRVITELPDGLLDLYR